MLFTKVPQKIDFPKGEKEILAFWKEQEIFAASLKQREGAERFVFYEGPPTANGTPHNGHVLTRVIKDLLPRYKTMRGYHVPRKAGWDTHGLPVEVAVEKELGIHGKEAIEAYGIEAFAQKCIDSVFRYTDVWQDLTERIGFWVDLEEAYVTYHTSYVESVWWALKTLFDKGLLYQGHKVVWWWPQGGTALSAGEVGLGYKSVDDPSVTVRFAVDGQDNTSFLAWTTTPWTLPSNCALAVHSDVDYSYVDYQGSTVIVATALLDSVLGPQRPQPKKKKKKKKGAAQPAAEVAEPAVVVDAWTVIKECKGSDLVGLAYQGPYDFVRPESGAFRQVIAADFVTTTSGTGVVHIAPAFGEDDFKVAKESGIGLINLIKPDGCFDDRAGDLAGQFCKAADRDIIRDLRARDLLVKEETYRHDYPFCWRADDDPLIQYARPAWFIETTSVTHKAQANNAEINWIPGHIKDGRFGDWLKNNVDWALSRERFWGTPLPLWKCETCDSHVALGSVAEIEGKNPNAFDAFNAAKAANPELNDHLKVHKPWIDKVVIPCDCGASMSRVTEVIDCWFDSGCMPFAQWGYPHKGHAEFDAAHPADFISEAVDQTRGWFYSLLMISTLLFGEKAYPHPYKNCVVLGHVTDKTGKKESKSKGNYTPPDKILDVDGADAMRWYFYAANPPWNNTRYSPEAVRNGQQEFLVKLRNVWAFFTIYAEIDGFDPNAQPKRPAAQRHLLDRWILSELHLTLRDVTVAMDEFGIYNAAQRIIALTDALSNWYVRRSRSRFWASADGDPQVAAAKWDAYHTLYEVLTTIAQMTAPFVPFITERIYQNMVVPVSADAPKSVHLCDWPTLDSAAIDEDLSVEMKAVRDLVSLGLQTRASHKLKVRQPLAKAQVILGNASLVDRVASYADLIAEELNVKAVVFSQDGSGIVTYGVKPNYRALGPVFGKRMPVVRKALDAADPALVCAALAASGEFQLTVEAKDGGTEEVTLTQDLVAVTVTAGEGFAASSGSVGVVVLDTQLSDALRAEGIARDVQSRLQGLRKDADLPYTARIEAFVTGPPHVLEATRAFVDEMAREVLADSIVVGEAFDGDRVVTAELAFGEDIVNVGIRQLLR